MENNEGYMAFRLATHVYSKWGFRSFLATLSSFVVSFLLSLYARVQAEEDDLGRFIVAGSVLLACLATISIIKVLHLATEFIFTPGFLATIGG